MGKRPRSPQNGEVPNGTVAPGRQRPEEILAQTLRAPRHLEATDGWSTRGRRLFLVALALAGAILLAAGLLVTGELSPGPAQPKPLSTGPGNGVADQLLRPIIDEGTTTPPGVLAMLAVVPSFAAPYATPVGQTVMALLLAGTVGLLVWMRRLALGNRPPRFLGTPAAESQMSRASGAVR